MTSIPIIWHSDEAQVLVLALDRHFEKSILEPFCRRPKKPLGGMRLPREGVAFLFRPQWHNFINFMWHFKEQGETPIPIPIPIPDPGPELKRTHLQCHRDKMHPRTARAPSVEQSSKGYETFSSIGVFWGQVQRVQKTRRGSALSAMLSASTAWPTSHVVGCGWRVQQGRWGTRCVCV